MITRITALSGLTSLWLVLLAAAAFAQPANKIVATVNGEMITQYALENRLKSYEARVKEQYNLTELSPQDLAQLKRTVLMGMVDNILLRDEAKRLGLDITTVELRNAVNKFKVSNKMTDQQMEEMLQAERITMAEFEEKMKDEILRNRLVGVMVTRKIVVSDEEVNSYYDNYMSSGGAGNMPASLQIITVSSAFDATALYQSIVSGEISFEDAAKQNSLGPATDKGGNLGPVSLEELEPSWREELKKVSPGQPTKPFIASDRQVILRQLPPEQSAAASESIVKEQIRERLFQAKTEERFKDYIESLREKAIIDIRL